MQTRSVIKVARENRALLSTVSIRDLTAAIVILEYRRLTEDNLIQADIDALCRLHEARCLSAEDALSGYRIEAAEEVANVKEERAENPTENAMTTNDTALLILRDMLRVPEGSNQALGTHDHGKHFSASCAVWDRAEKLLNFLDDTIRCLCAKCKKFTDHTVPGGKCLVCDAALPTAKEISEMDLA